MAFTKELAINKWNKVLDEIVKLNEGSCSDLLRYFGVPPHRISNNTGYRSLGLFNEKGLRNDSEEDIQKLLVWAKENDSRMLMSRTREYLEFTFPVNEGVWYERFWYSLSSNTPHDSIRRIIQHLSTQGLVQANAGLKITILDTSFKSTVTSSDLNAVFVLISNQFGHETTLDMVQSSYDRVGIIRVFTEAKKELNSKLEEIKKRSTHLGTSDTGGYMRDDAPISNQHVGFSNTGQMFQSNQGNNSMNNSFGGKVITEYRFLKVTPPVTVGGGEGMDLEIRSPGSSVKSGMDYFRDYVTEEYAMEEDCLLDLVAENEKLLRTCPILRDLDRYLRTDEYLITKANIPLTELFQKYPFIACIIHLGLTLCSTKISYAPYRIDRSDSEVRRLAQASIDVLCENCDVRCLLGGATFVDFYQQFRTQIAILAKENSGGHGKYETYVRSAKAVDSWLKKDGASVHRKKLFLDLAWKVKGEAKDELKEALRPLCPSVEAVMMEYYGMITPKSVVASEPEKHWARRVWAKVGFTEEEWKPLIRYLEEQNFDEDTPIKMKKILERAEVKTDGRRSKLKAALRKNPGPAVENKSME
jgi:hypothetical protein